MKPAHPVILLALGPVWACGQPLDHSSRHLEPLRDDPWPPGERCFLSTEDKAPGNYVRLISRGDEAVVRVQGRSLILSFEGGNLRAGGTFRRGPLTIKIDGISKAAATSPTPIGEISVVTVSDVGVEEKFEGLWTC